MDGVLIPAKIFAYVFVGSLISIFKLPPELDDVTHLFQISFFAYGIYFIYSQKTDNNKRFKEEESERRLQREKHETEIEYWKLKTQKLK